MTAPFCIWCRQRTGSITLFNALAKISNAPAAESEPFDGSVEARQFSDVPSAPNREERLDRICREGWLIKHVFDTMPIDFNLALAAATERAGYRHIHLLRADETARIVSLGIAEQKALWFKHAVTERSIQDILSGRRKFDPLPIGDLVRRSGDGPKLWRQIAPALGPILTVTTESVLQPSVIARHRRLLRILNFLEMSAIHLGEVDDMLEGKGQDSARLAYLVPNIHELRCAMLAR